MEQGQVEVDIVERRRDYLTSTGFLKAWNILSTLGVLIPFVVFAWARITSNDEDEDFGNDADEEYRKVANCDDQIGAWWKFWCLKYFQERENADVAATGAPWWWSWKAQREENSFNRVMILVYIFTILLVIGMSITMKRKLIEGKMKSVKWLLVCFANYVFICAVLIGGIPQLIIDQGEEVRKTQWYSQVTVLIFLTCIFELLVCLIFVIKIRKIISRQEEELEGDGTAYVYF